MHPKYKFPNVIRLSHVILSLSFGLLVFYTYCAINIYKSSKVSGQIDLLQQSSKVPNNHISTRTTPLNNKKHWCIIATKYLPKTTREHFGHFPHSLEIILPCWSYFMSRSESGTNIHCGFYIASDKIVPGAWTQQLLDKMGCEVKYRDISSEIKNDPDQLPDDNGKVAILKNDEQHIPNLFLLRPRHNYIRYVYHQDDAHALRRLFISDEEISMVKGNNKPFQIGMIQRTTSRRIGNFEEIRLALQKALPDAIISATEFEYDTVEEQARWFATKDVIIGAHGAAFANSIFITPGTIVMQCYPPGYFWPSLEPLIEQVGGYAIQWYEKGNDPHVVASTIDHQKFNEAGQGLTPFNPPVEEIVNPILYSLGVLLPSINNVKKVYKKFI